MRAVLTNWTAHTLTLIGRIQVVIALVISLTTQILTVLPESKKFLKEAKQIIVHFLWAGKKPKIAYDALIQDIANGGLKLIDIATKSKALKLTWAKKATEEQPYFWEAFGKILPP